MASSFRLSLVLILILLPASGFADEIIPGLIVNYSDFSYISSIAVGYHYVYFGTTRGIIKYSITKSEWGEPMTGIEGLRELSIHEIKASYDDESIWVRTDLGVFEYSETLKRWNPVDEMPDVISRVRHLLPDEHYFAPWGYDYVSNGALVDGIGRIFQLTDIVDDNWTNLWIGTWGLGAARSDNTSRRIELLEYGLLQKDITTIHVNDGVLWMGGRVADSYRTGITIFDWSRNSFQYVESYGGLTPQAANVNDICTSDEDVFVATDNGIWVINEEDREISSHLRKNSGLPDDRVLAVLFSGDTLFVGTEFGLGIFYAYSDSTEPVVEILLPSLTILCLEKTDDALWLGTNHGAYRLSLETKKLSRLSAPEISRFGNIFDIRHAGDKMWLATEDELASIDLNTAGIEIFPEVNNYGGVKAIAVRDTILAAATGRGLLLIHNGAKPHHELFTANEGLISDDIRDLLFDGEYLWLGTDQGLIRFWYKNPSL